jgi:hypothetical protein
VPSRKKGAPLPVYSRFFRENLGEQFDCEVDDVVEALLDVYNNYEKYIYKARQGRQWVEQYDTANRELQRLYQTLVKPRSVVFGNENVIKNDEIVTNSLNLFMKYQDLISLEAR